jgi:hypothetical protein
MKEKTTSLRQQKKALEIERSLVELRMQTESRYADLNRIRSLTVGTAFGGVTEISVRANNGQTHWGLFQPVEVIELIHQLAANIGCHINLQPRNDFGSWRDWKVTDEEKLFYGPFPPYQKQKSGALKNATALPKPELQPGLKLERNENEPVATKKTVNRRSTKRAATTT